MVCGCVADMWMEMVSPVPAWLGCWLGFLVSLLSRFCGILLRMRESLRSQRVEILGVLFL